MLELCPNKNLAAHFAPNHSRCRLWCVGKLLTDMTAWKRELGFHRSVPASDPAPLARGYRHKRYQPSLFWPLTCCPHPCAHREPVPPGVQPFVEETGPALLPPQQLHCSPGDSCQEDPSPGPVRTGPLCLSCTMCALGRTKSFHYSMSYGAKCSRGIWELPPP